MADMARRWVSALARSRRLRAPHAIRGAPLLGSLLEFRHRRLALLEHAAALGDVVALRLGAMPAALISSPELAHDMLSEHHDDAVQAPTLRIVGQPLIGRGVLTAEGAAHVRQRKLLAPAFSPKRVARYAAAMLDGAQRTIDSWSDGCRVDAAAEMMRMTLEIAARVLFDAEIGFEATEFGAALTIAMEEVLAASNAFVPVPSHWPTPGNLRLRRAVRRLDRTVSRIIDARRRDPRDRGDVLSMLLAARDDDGRAMTDQLLRDEVMTLLLAGHETTANALSWCIFALATDPVLRAGLEREVDEAFGTAPTPTAEHVQMPLVDATLKETLRLYPPAYLIGRYTTRDFEIGGAFLPAGTMVLVNIYGIHRSSRLYADAAQFLPSRFLPPNDVAIPRRAYMPFGTGPRTCIGNHFALLEGRLALAALVRRVRLHLDGAQVVPEPLLTLRPGGGLPVRVERRS